MTTIKYPGKHDVMLGRGGESNYHSGNIAFRHMVQKYKERFRLGSRTEKNKVIDEVVNEWRDQDPIGRFVAKKKTDTGDVVWYDVGDALAKKRAAKSLAEWTPATSFQSGVAKKSPPTQERRKRSRPAASTGSSRELFQPQASSNKRQMIAPPAPVNSFTVMSMVASAQQLPEERLHEPMPLFSFGTDQDFLSSAMGDSTQDSFSSSSSSGIIKDFLGSYVAASNQGSFPTSSDAISNTAVTSLNQPCNININSMEVLPIDRIRYQIPTAAELAGNAFSDDSDEKSWHSNSSRGSIQGRGSCHGGLLPNKLAEMAFPFKKEAPSVISFSSDFTATRGIFGEQNKLVDPTIPSKDTSSIIPLACDNTVTMGVFGEKHLWMI